MPAPVKQFYFGGCLNDEALNPERINIIVGINARLGGTNNPSLFKASGSQANVGSPLKLLAPFFSTIMPRIHATSGVTLSARIRHGHC